MSDPKPLASLSPTLLARKGSAKPAMRRQVHYPDSLARNVLEDDLGWNDMGDEDSAAHGTPEPSSAPLTEQLREPGAEPAGEVVPIKGQVELPADPLKPMVLRHQEEIARQVIPPAPVSVPAAAHVAAAVSFDAPAAVQQLAQGPLKARRSALENGRRAAFTLRMDAERHLKLRLACTIRNRSAQQLITEALDKLIDELPDLATLAAQVAERR